jgi:aryl-alcohol dehydrogenase-like predicted oxidoreductase
METRSFGRSGLKVSVLGFGCGAVGGLMVRGTETEQERAFARALDAGITYFDTAAIYGDGVSEQNLGKVVRRVNRVISSTARRCEFRVRKKATFAGRSMRRSRRA